MKTPAFVLLLIIHVFHHVPALSVWKDETEEAVRRQTESESAVASKADPTFEYFAYDPAGDLVDVVADDSANVFVGSSADSSAVARRRRAYNHKKWVKDWKSYKKWGSSVHKWHKGQYYKAKNKHSKLSKTWSKKWKALKKKNLKHHSKMHKKWKALSKKHKHYHKQWLKHWTHITTEWDKIAKKFKQLKKSHHKSKLHNKKMLAKIKKWHHKKKLHYAKKLRTFTKWVKTQKSHLRKKVRKHKKWHSKQSKYYVKKLKQLKKGHASAVSAAKISTRRRRSR
jgi:hypothetical protein